MKKYVSPEVEVIYIDTVDVITFSVGEEVGGGNGSHNLSGAPATPSDGSNDNLIDANIWTETVSE